MFLSVAGLCVAPVLKRSYDVFMCFYDVWVNVGSCRGGSCEFLLLGYWLFCVVFLLCSCIYCIFVEAHYNPLFVQSDFQLKLLKLLLLKKAYST